MKRIILAAALLPVLTQCACSGALAEPHRPEDLIRYIQVAEKAEIRESWGEDAGQCFTQDDYDHFVRARRPAEVAGILKTTAQFRKLVEMIKSVPQTEREQLLARARKTARPTWSMISRISRDGTTEAGREAALLLAGAIADAVEGSFARD